jgi:hypothetical protein
VGQTEITGRSDCLMRKNGEDYVIDFACAKSCHVFLYAGSRRLLHNLTDMHRKPSASLGLRVAMVPESYHWPRLCKDTLYQIYIPQTTTEYHLLIVTLLA